MLGGQQLNQTYDKNFAHNNMFDLRNHFQNLDYKSIFDAGSLHIQVQD